MLANRKQIFFQNGSHTLLDTTSLKTKDQDLLFLEMPIKQTLNLSSGRPHAAPLQPEHNLTGTQQAAEIKLLKQASIFF